MAVTNVLEFDSLYLEFGHHRVLQDVYIKCLQGEVAGLLGRNGSGKSCLMKIVFGSMEAYMQSVRINGSHLPDVNIKKGYINYLPQDNFIPPFLTIKEVLRQYDIDAKAFGKFMPELATAFQLSRKISELSGGEVRLIEIYIILIRPSLFSILDEPFSQLMPLHVERVMELISRVKTQKGIVLTDHQYRYLLQISDRTYLLYEGKTIPVKEKEDLTRFGYLPDV